MCVCCPWSLSVRVCGCLARLTVDYQCDCVHSWSSRSPGVWSPADPLTKTAMIGGLVGTTPQLCLGCCALVPLASSEGPLPRVEEDGLDSPWAPCVLRVCGFLQNGVQSPRSRPLVATLGRDQWSRPGYWVSTRGRGPWSRPGFELVATHGHDPP